MKNLILKMKMTYTKEEESKEETIMTEVKEILEMVAKRNAELTNKYSSINNYLAVKKQQKEELK